MIRRTILMALAAGMLAASIQAQDGIPVIFIPMTPCRMVDTRVDSSGGLITGAIRNLTLTGAAYSGVPVAKACTAATGAPVNSASLQLNFTMANMSGSSDLRVAPWGTAPVNSIMNSISGLNIAQEAIETVATNGAGQRGISVLAGGTSFNLIIDVLGYFTTSYRNDNQYLRSTSNTTNNSYAAFLVNNSTSACGGDCGIVVDTFTTGSNTTADFFNGDSGAEVNYGVTSNVYSSGDNSAAVFGSSNNASGTNFGLWGVSASTLGRGVFGDATATGFAVNFGVYGQSEGGFGGAGVYGLANCGGSCYGVFGDIGNGTLYGVYSNGAAYVSGDLTVTGSIFAGVKDFIAPYPGDASKEIRYTAAEGPEALAFVRGKVQVVNGFATISLPDHFRLSIDADSMTVNLTPVGGMASVGVARIAADKIVIQASRDMRVDYVVYGERSAYRGQQPVLENTHFRPQYEGKASEAWPANYLDIMKRNGILNADGTANMDTARRLGWTLLPASANPSSRSLAIDSKRVMDDHQQKAQEKRALVSAESQ